NGSFSNMYHWNGGPYYTDGVFDSAKWSASSKAFSPGFFATKQHRGTTRLHVNGNNPSLISDGDYSTYWWSEPSTRTSPRFYLDAGGATVSSVKIYWANPFPRGTSPFTPSLSTHDPGSNTWPPM